MSTCSNCKKLILEISELKKRIQELETETSVDIIFDQQETKVQFETLNLKQDHLKTIINNNYTEEFFYKGPKGVGEFICQYIICNSEKYKCVDRNKITFFYRDPQNPEIRIKDIKCKILFDKVFPPLLKRINELYKKLMADAYNNLDEYDDEYDDESDTDNESKEDTDTESKDEDYKEIVEVENREYYSSSDLTDRICDTYVEILKLDKKKTAVLIELINFSFPLD